MQNTISQPVPVFSQEAILNAVATLRAKEGSNGNPLTANSRVNEQELFAAFTYLQLKEQQPKLANSFLSKFRSALSTDTSNNSEYAIVDAARGILQEFRQTKLISRGMFIKIRQVGLGLSQLDSIRDSLNVGRVTQGANDTALRSVGTALKKISENTIATRDELRSFVARNKIRTSGGL